MTMLYTYYGKVQKCLTVAETTKHENPGCRFWVTFKNNETGDVLPACLGLKWKAKNCAAGFAASLATAMRARGNRTASGGDYRWALLRTKEA